MNVFERFREAFRVFRGRDRPLNPISNQYPFELGNPGWYGGVSSADSPDRFSSRHNGEQSIVDAILTKIALDVAGVQIHHAKVDENGTYQDTIKDSLEELFTVEANIDQSYHSYMVDLVRNLFDEGVIALFATILSGEVIREERINLRVRVTCADDEEGQSPREYYAMNEVAAARGAKGNIVDFDFSIAGGPLVGPTFTGMIVAPLAPHTLNARPIVAERNDIIEIDMPDDMQVGDVGLFIDGDTIELDSPIKNVTIMVGPDPTVILSCRKDSFYKQISRTFFDKK